MLPTVGGGSVPPSPPHDARRNVAPEIARELTSLGIFLRTVRLMQFLRVGGVLTLYEPPLGLSREKIFGLPCPLE
jgi:hypothetical protein